MLFYILTGTTLFTALLVTILNGLAYAALQSTPAHTAAAGLAPVALSVLTCTTLTSLAVILHKDIQSNTQWSKWKQGVFYFAGTYLLIAAASVTGTVTKDELLSTTNQQSLFIARSIFWAFSLLTQGAYYGYILVSLKQTPSPAWPQTYNSELKTLDSRTTITPPSRAVTDPDSPKFDTRRSSLRKFPRHLNATRFSGCTLDLDKDRHSIFTTSSGDSPTKPEPSPTLPYPDTRPFLHGGSTRSTPSLRAPTASLNTLIRQPSTTSTCSYLDAPASPAASITTFEGQENIHPLFRSNSPCPSPTPGPGSCVMASPSAGQMITQQTLTRMRSARSLRENRSPLPSPSSERRFELSESPEEK
ncbi:hypothetical protein N7532_007382 [Penicillium argentinense]|uniref:Uncharacterized protein n=1 Tax=Penicillium argentinense TaxID=1131581 RepID=A0A9W9F7K3_9EURO|nr:uncharacterized protein N7532_007382 [Penicillium argentinense]KAJ5095091.1 hypothetical protein N7532_007382 [Penicillium argentinense]